MRKVFGLVGPIASGKGTVGQILREFGYEYYSLSERIREELTNRKLPITRQGLQDMGDELRGRFGDDVLAQRTCQLIASAGQTRIVIDSIRTPAEIKFLKKNLGALIIGVNASPETRFKRLLAREREGEPRTWEEFLAADRRETEKCSDSSKINISACLELSDFVLENEGTADDLMEGIREILRETQEGKKSRERK